MSERIIEGCGGSVAGKTFAVLGLTFKPNTDDMRDSPSLVILPALCNAGATIRAFDPAGMREAAKLMPDIAYCDNEYTAIADADALIILTEWNEFRALDLARIRQMLRQPLIFDFRNIYEPAEMAKFGFDYHSIGRTFVNGVGGIRNPALWVSFGFLERVWNSAVATDEHSVSSTRQRKQITGTM